MNIHISTIHHVTPVRFNALRTTLLHHNHKITDIKHADIWFVDCIWPHKIDNNLLHSMLQFNGKIILMSLGDRVIFKLDNLPDILIETSC